MRENVKYGKLFYVSITGLQVKRWYNWPKFWYHSSRCMAQAKNSDGNIAAEARSITDVMHTMSVWQNKKSMQAFLTQGPHKKAIAAFPEIAIGRTFGFHTRNVPEWNQVHQLWLDYGSDYSVSENQSKF